MAKKAVPRSRKSGKTPARAKKPAARKAAPSRRKKTPAEKPARKSRGGKSFGRLHQVALKATDIEASVAFYRDLLGLALIARFDPPGLAFFDMDGTRLLLSPNSSQGTLYFTVADLDAMVRALEARGLAFAEKPTLVHRDEAGQFGEAGEEEWMAFFRDPSGNLLALATRR